MKSELKINGGTLSVGGVKIEGFSEGFPEIGEKDNIDMHTEITFRLEDVNTENLLKAWGVEPFVLTLEPLQHFLTWMSRIGFTDICATNEKDKECIVDGTLDGKRYKGIYLSSDGLIKKESKNYTIPVVFKYKEGWYK